MRKADRQKDKILALRTKTWEGKDVREKPYQAPERQPPAQALPTRREHRASHRQWRRHGRGLEDQLCVAIEMTRSLETQIQKTAQESREISILRTQKCLLEIRALVHRREREKGRVREKWIPGYIGKNLAGLLSDSGGPGANVSGGLKK